ncbi:MAG: NAD-dependent epimerase/dehydratase family protein [Clostridium sp.]|nr:NAD-dependent epimerase/dehydratase family protein [Clostridium sp.]
MNILVTGGTVFASRFTAEYFINKKNNVYVLNRGNNIQSPNVIHIKGDRHNLGDILKKYHFDAVLDITAYNYDDVKLLIEGLGTFDNYVLVSSSAVYSETLKQPFNEQQQCGENCYWGDYGKDKLAAEQYVTENIKNAYIIRPPYLYGPMNNLYREAFVFECAENDLPFCIPKDGKMPLQFFHIKDMCRFIEILLDKQPLQKIYNVGNTEIIDINKWVELCYKVLNKKPEIKYIDSSVPQRSYFPFLDYSYILDVTKQNELMQNTIPLFDGLCESYEWYKNNRELIRRKPLIDYINQNF